MRVRAIKQELEAAGVVTSDCFEKAEMAERLVAFRLRGPDAVPMAAAAEPQAEDSAPEDSASPQSPSATQEPAAEAAAPAEDEAPSAEILERCRAMRIKELRTELGTRGLPWADALEKEELVQRLAGVLAQEGNYCRTGLVHPGVVAQLTGAQLDEELSYPSTPVLVDMFADWCGPCKMMAPQLDSAARKLGNTVRVVKLDVDQEQEMAGRLRVSAMPTLILFNRQGQEVARREGALMEQDLINLVRNFG